MKREGAGEKEREDGLRNESWMRKGERRVVVRDDGRRLAKNGFSKQAAGWLDPHFHFFHSLGGGRHFRLCR
jgi:hypothetical protein